MVFQTRYLLLMALMLMLLNWVNTTGEYILGSIVKDTAANMVAAGQAIGLTEGQLIGDFYSKYFTLVNVLGLLLQLFVVSRVVKYLGIPWAVMILPMHFARRLQHLAFYPGADGRAGGQGGGELDRLFAQQHRAQHAVPAVHRTSRSSARNRRSTRSSCAWATCCRRSSYSSGRRGSRSIRAASPPSTPCSWSPGSCSPGALAGTTSG